MVFFLQILIALVALCGLSIALYISHKKVHGGKMVCMLNSDCEVVVTSNYSKFLGIPVERLGIAYYSIVAASYLVFAFAPQLSHNFYSVILLWATVLAFLFSIYLTYIQMAKIKQWCTWCLTSAIICTVIFLAVLKLISIF